MRLLESIGPKPPAKLFCSNQNRSASGDVAVERRAYVKQIPTGSRCHAKDVSFTKRHGFHNIVLTEHSVKVYTVSNTDTE